MKLIGWKWYSEAQLCFKGWTCTSPLMFHQKVAVCTKNSQHFKCLSFGEIYYLPLVPWPNLVSMIKMLLRIKIYKPLLNFMSYHSLLMFSQKSCRILLLAECVLIMLISPYEDAYFVTPKLSIPRGYICYSFFYFLQNYTIHAYVHKHACALTPMNDFNFHPILFYYKSNDD